MTRGNTQLRMQVARQTQLRVSTPTELEVAALVFAVEHFEVYLLGNKVTVFTDHQALVSPFIYHLQSQTRGLLARWYLRLSRFLPNLKLEYKPGHQNTAADALSRAPVGASPVFAVSVEGDDGSKEPVLGKVQTEQRNHPQLCKLIEYLEKAKLPEDSKEATQIAIRAISWLMVYCILSQLILKEEKISGTATSP